MDTKNKDGQGYIFPEDQMSIIEADRERRGLSHPDADADDTETSLISKSAAANATGPEVLSRLKARYPDAASSLGGAATGRMNSRTGRIWPRHK